MSTRAEYWIEKIEKHIGRKLTGSYLERSDVNWEDTYSYLRLSLLGSYPFLTPPLPSQVLFEILLELGHNPYHDDRAIRRACDYDNLEVLATLLSDRRADSALRDSKIFVALASAGKYACAKMLLEHGAADPSVDDNIPLRYARYLGHFSIANLLLSDPRVTE